MKKKKKSEFFSEKFQFFEVKLSIYLNRRVFVMKTTGVWRGSWSRENAAVAHIRIVKTAIGQGFYYMSLNYTVPTQQIYNVAGMSLQHHCNVSRLQRRCNDVVATFWVCWAVIIWVSSDGSDQTTCRWKAMICDFGCSLTLKLQSQQLSSALSSACN